MRANIFCCLTSFLLSVCVNACAQNKFESNGAVYGEWRSIEFLRGESKPYSTFVIKLRKLNDGHVSGGYCFITQGVRRIDCDPDGVVDNLSGDVDADGRHARLNFYSYFGAKNGVADVNLNKGDLIWSVIKAPIGDFFYGPNNSDLKRYDPDDERRRQVNVDRAYLYVKPESAINSKVYVINGDWVMLLRISENLKYWKVKYQTKEGKDIEGWIKCEAINSCP